MEKRAGMFFIKKGAGRLFIYLNGSSRRKLFIMKIG
jgi:hypothetical protein